MLKNLICFSYTVSDSVNRGMSTAGRTRASLYDWIVYKRGSKAKEKERKRQVATRGVIYNP